MVEVSPDIREHLFRGPPGKLADTVLLDADSLHNIANTSAICSVVEGG